MVHIVALIIWTEIEWDYFPILTMEWSTLYAFVAISCSSCETFIPCILIPTSRSLHLLYSPNLTSTFIEISSSEIRWKRITLLLLTVFDTDPVGAHSPYATLEGLSEHVG